MRRKRPEAALLWAVLVNSLLIGDAFASRPPPPPITMPGDVRGRLYSRWLAPYVQTTEMWIGRASRRSVLWFSPEGKLLREASGRGIYVQPGFVSVREKGVTTIHAVNGRWKFVLPRKEAPPGFVGGCITATADSRVFIRQFHPRRGLIGVDVYVSGELASTIGPLPSYKCAGVGLAPDGSSAFLSCETAAGKTVQVVVAGPDGKERFRPRCEGTIISPEPAPGGKGVLLQSDAGGDKQNVFTFYDRSGKVRSLKVEHNPHLMGWIPGTCRALFVTSVGHGGRFRLVDWTTGRTLWHVPNPCTGNIGALESVVVETDRILIAGHDLIQWGTGKEPVRTVCAVDPSDGHTVARWHPSPMRPDHEYGRLLKLGERVYLMTAREFSEIDKADIAARKDGWR
ncbi:MAG: hypothetical protein ACYSU0_14515 [Planctomycetota bacterium]|jgi:hypothetical protein